MHQNYNFLFWNNTYEEIWYAIPRDKAIEFFGGSVKKEQVEGVLSDKSIDNLIKRINK